uniref:(northern house mosquito) hypothetical protein n=1 Tax=Culex pipiens TaxID=7175 RepID=A0A8D8J5N3_CULPI
MKMVTRREITPSWPENPSPLPPWRENTDCFRSDGSARLVLTPFPTSSFSMPSIGWGQDHPQLSHAVAFVARSVLVTPARFRPGLLGPLCFCSGWCRWCFIATGATNRSWTVCCGRWTFGTFRCTKTRRKMRVRK